MSKKNKTIPFQLRYLISFLLLWVLGGIILLTEPGVYLFTQLHWLKEEGDVNCRAGMVLSIQDQEPFESALLVESFV